LVTILLFGLWVCTWVVAKVLFLVPLVLDGIADSCSGGRIRVEKIAETHPQVAVTALIVEQEKTVQEVSPAQQIHSIPSPASNDGDEKKEQVASTDTTLLAPVKPSVQEAAPAHLATLQENGAYAWFP